MQTDEDLFREATKRCWELESDMEMIARKFKNVPRHYQSYQQAQRLIAKLRMERNKLME